MSSWFESANSPVMGSLSVPTSTCPPPTFSEAALCDQSSTVRSSPGAQLQYSLHGWFGSPAENSRP